VRIAVAAVSMWTIWVLAYLVAMSPHDWYRAYHHMSGHGLSLAADQQIAAGVLWFLAASCFVPLIFWNLLQWLRSEEDPDEELQRLVREERRRSAPPPIV
jgi:cytochrome c oxidase assembly factor CtaG